MQGRRSAHQLTQLGLLLTCGMCVDGASSSARPLPGRMNSRTPSACRKQCPPVTAQPAYATGSNQQLPLRCVLDRGRWMPSACRLQRPAYPRQAPQVAGLIGRCFADRLWTYMSCFAVPESYRNALHSVIDAAVHSSLNVISGFILGLKDL